MLGRTGRRAALSGRRRVGRITVVPFRRRVVRRFAAFRLRIAPTRSDWPSFGRFPLFAQLQRFGIAAFHFAILHFTGFAPNVLHVLDRFFVNVFDRLLVRHFRFSAGFIFVSD